MAFVVIVGYFSSQGWKSWDIDHRPLIPERMPVLVDDDPRFGDSRVRRRRWR